MAAEFELNPIAIEVYLMTNPELEAELLRLAKEGEAYGRSIAPVGDKEHKLKSGYIDKPGDYRDSIEGMVVQGHRRMKGRVRATDYKAHWIEYGTQKMTKRAVLRQVADHLGGELHAPEA
jgi:hypothetical protein